MEEIDDDEEILAEEEEELLMEDIVAVEEEEELFMEDIGEDEDILAAEGEEEEEEEEELFMEETDDDDEIFFDDDSDDWGAALLAAQESIDGKIAGLEDALVDDEEAAVWKSAETMAKNLGKSLYTDDEDEEFDDEEELALSDVEDLDALGAAARAAVEMTGDEYELSDVDLTDDESSFEDLVAAAREAVEAMGPPVVDPALRDWSTLTVAQLRNELRDRGLPTTGKKADLVALLQESDLDLEQDGEVGVEDTIDVDVMANLFGEVFGTGSDPDMEMDSEPDFFDSEDDEADMADAIEIEVYDWSTSTVAQLRTELKNRGLATAGKKGDLLARLEEDDLAAALREVRGEDAEAARSEGEMEGEIGDEYEEQSVDYSAMTIVELKNELRARGLRVSGRKQELIDRLQSATTS